MQTPNCKDCQNIPVFEAYGAQVTAAEDSARLSYGSGCLPGKIVCRGAVHNPVFGDFCEASLVQPEVPEHPEATKLISPASSVKEIPGYDIYAKQLK